MSTLETVEVKRARRIPRGEKRRSELVAVAAEVFFEHGFTDTTMQMIASRAGASKETLYRHFTSKEDLFAEIVRRRAASIWSAIGELAREGEPRRRLFDLGLNLLRMMLQGDSSSLLRVVIAEASRAPELGAIFYAQGPGSVLDHATTYLRGATARGQLRCRNPAQAARLFLGSVVADHHLLKLVALSAEPLSEAAMRAHVRAAVAMFLARYGRPVTTRVT